MRIAHASLSDKRCENLFILIDFIHDPCVVDLSYIPASVEPRTYERAAYAESSTKERRRSFILARA